MEQEIQSLRGQVHTLDSTLTGIKHFLKVGADYKNENPEQIIAAIQAALGKAAEYHKPGKAKRQRRNR